MRLVIVPELFKAGKIGLMPVKKQVSKKGTTFMQTFYVKPGDEKVAKKTKSASKDAPEKAPERSAKKLWNTPDGFYIAMENVNVRIANKAVLHQFKFAGHEFVVINKVIGDVANLNVNAKHGLSFLMLDSSSFMVYEKNTGLSVTPHGLEYSSPASAEKAAVDTILRISNSKGATASDFLTKMVSAQTPAKDNGNPYVYVMAFGNPEEAISKTDAMKLIGECLSRLPTDYPKEYELAAKADPQELLTSENVYDWIGTGRTEKVFRGLLSEVSDKFILHEAVVNKITYDDACIREDAIAQIMYDLKDYANEVSGSNPILGGADTREAVAKWGKDFQDNFSNGVTMPNEGIGTNISPGEYWAYAITKDLAIEVAVESINNDNMDRVLDGNFTDAHGSVWELEELKPLRLWVKGGDPLKEYRKEAKEIFAERAAGRPDGESGTFMQSIESHVHRIPVNTDGVIEHLFRGTQNPAWAGAKVGDIIPIGMASFSKSYTTAHNFASTAILSLYCGDDTDPVYGVDINELSDTLSNGDENSVAALNVTDIDGCKTEKEVIVMSPAFEVMSMGETSDGRYAEIVVRQRDMELVHLIKSKFDNAYNRRIEILEKEFDLSLHRPHGMTDKKKAAKGDK